jgi:hypothetical protein
MFYGGLNRIDRAILYLPDGVAPEDCLARESALEIHSMRMRILSVCSQVAELGVFFAAAAVLAVGLMGVR